MKKKAAQRLLLVHTGFLFSGIHLVGICRLSFVKERIFIAGVTAHGSSRISFGRIVSLT
jgi:hypothetical protein